MRHYRSAPSFALAIVVIVSIFLGPTSTSAGAPAFIRSLYAIRHTAYSLEGSLPVDMAVKVADGYLVATVDAMGRIREDMRNDPRVVLMHGNERYEGQYVDFDPPTGMALIRADVPGEPMQFSSSAEIDQSAWVVGVKDDQMLGKDFPVLAIDAKAAGCAHLDAYQMNACNVSRDVLPFTCIVTPDGKLQTLLSYARKPNAYAETTTIGPSADRAKQFLTRYFRSMGSSIHPKPTF